MLSFYTTHQLFTLQPVLYSRLTHPIDTEQIVVLADNLLCIPSVGNDLLGGGLLNKSFLSKEDEELLGMWVRYGSVNLLSHIRQRSFVISTGPYLFDQCRNNLINGKHEVCFGTKHEPQIFFKGVLVQITGKQVLAAF